MNKFVSLKEPNTEVQIRRDKYIPGERTKKMYGNLALPSYVHGYSLAIEYMHDWFESRFPKDFFKGGIYVDGKHVLDDYKHFSKRVIKGQNPRARMAPTVEYDFDREGVDLYDAPPELFLRRSNFQDSFFKDHDRDMYLGINMRALRMNFAYKVRVSTRSQQLDTFNRMNMYFRIGATQHDYVSVDFHVPKDIMHIIAEKAGFEIKNNRVVDIIEFIAYLNRHSDLPFLFKMRAINQQPEYFIRLNGLYTHISTKDRLQMDDGERDGKLDFNFHVEMNAVLTIPIPHFYAFYSAEDLMRGVTLKENDENTIAIYSINVFDIPKKDEHDWNLAATTEYMTGDNETEIDLTPLFEGDNILSQAIQHDLTNGVSPSKFINIKIFRSDDVAKMVNIRMDWKNKIAKFIDKSIDNEKLSIAIYYDREYINELDTILNEYRKNRIN